MLRQQFLSPDKLALKAPYSMRPIGICIHNTYNDASAQNERDNVNRPDNNAKVSFHIAVDDKEAIQLIPFNRNAFHAGDGRNGNGNRNYIAVEICYSKSGGQRFIQAEKRAVQEVAALCKEFGFTIANIKPHKYFSGKPCPHRTNIDSFIQKVSNLLNTSNSSPQPNIVWDDSVRGKIGTVTASVLNVRYTADGKIIGTLKRGSKVRLWRLEGDWYHINSPFDGYNQAYVHKNYISIDNSSPQVTASNKKYGIVTAKSGLNVRKGAGSNYPVVGVLKYGERVQLDVKVGKWWSTYYGAHGGFASADYIREE